LTFPVDATLPSLLSLLLTISAAACLQKDPVQGGSDGGPADVAVGTGGGSPSAPGTGGARSQMGNSGSGGSSVVLGAGSGGTGALPATGGVGPAEGSGGGTATASGGSNARSGGATGSGGKGPGTGGMSQNMSGGTGGQNGSGSGGNGTGGSGTGGNGTGGMGTGGAIPVPGPGEPQRLTSGSSGWASRYWDCCKPACGWKANVRSGNPMNSCSQSNQVLGSADTKNACDGGGGGAFMCWSGAPWSISDTMSYGFVAASGSNYVCGRCYQVQFTGSGHNGANPGATSLNYKSMIVQVINNGGVASDQMDLLIPGGGVGALNACSTQWGNVDLGSQYGGFYAACKNDKTCTAQMCQTAFANKPELQAGCTWFLDWFNGADNPAFIFKQISCPSAITQRSGLSDPG
jgi:hypothetical protein